MRPVTTVVDVTPVMRNQRHLPSDARKRIGRPMSSAVKPAPALTPVVLSKVSVIVGAKSPL